MHKILKIQLFYTEGWRCHHITSGFAKLGGGVTTRTVAGTRTAGGSPDCVQLTPQLRKAASPLCASDGSAVDEQSKCAMI